MKVHSQEFKDTIAGLGRQQDVIITYTLDNEEITLTSEDINSATPVYEANLLKSVMKELELDSNIDIPLDTQINFKYGIYIESTGQYEYLDFGNYIVYSSEKQEDQYSYKIKCYDKMLYSMVEYEAMNITYPIAIREYLGAICTHLGITFANSSDVFANYNKEIPYELYLDSDGNGMDYTFRDVLTEIAQATGSVICINNNDELEVRYPVETNDIIDEEYLKDTGVSFKEKYGPINSIVLSRSAESDNVYLRDEQSVTDNGLCEVKIADNQIMNFNDRSDYLQGILASIGGIEYYTCDYTSTGICYYDLLDYYTVTVGEQNYKCLMLNDEIDITQGLEEHIHAELPEVGETDYEVADETDRRINQTYLIVDKQNQKIESVITNITQQNNKISQITQTVDELNSKISDVADITISGESMQAYVELAEINESEPISITVRPVGKNISYLYPHDNLYPDDILYMPDRKIRFIRTYDNEGETATENIDYVLPDDLLYYDSNNYDEFLLNYETQTCQIRKKCKYNADGTVALLEQEETTDYEYPQILLGDGDYRIELLGYDTGYIAIRLMAKNIYTSQFATKAEVSSAITQTSQEINLSVDTKLDSYPTKTEMNSAISITANEINSTVSKKVGKDEIISSINQSAEAVAINANKINLNGKTINLTSENIAIQSTNFNVDKNGTVNMVDTYSSGVGNRITIKNRNNSDISAGIGSSGYDFNTSNLRSYLFTGPSLINMYMRNSDANTAISMQVGNSASTTLLFVRGGGNTSYVYPDHMQSRAFNTSSLESIKKNFEELKNALDIIKQIDIYKYNFDTEQDIDKKHIGFVIGNKYNYSQEVTSAQNDSADIYSFVSVCCKAIQEQQEQIEQMKKEIEELKGGNE